MFHAGDFARSRLAPINLAVLLLVDVRVVLLQLQGNSGLDVFHGVVLITAATAPVVSKVVAINQLLHGELVQLASFDCVGAFNRRNS